jgi:excisionase family DNA binding protein
MAERRERLPEKLSEATAMSWGSSDTTMQHTDRRTGARRPAVVAAAALDALPPLLTIDEVAAVLRMSRKAIYAMAERAQLPGVVRIGRRLLVSRDDLRSWLDERRTASQGGTQ